MNSFAFHIVLDPPKPWSEIAISWLANYSFNAFEETEFGIIAYTSESNTHEHERVQIDIANWANIVEIECSLRIETIPQQNWNAKWESDFQPVHVEDKLIILAPFHEKPETTSLVIEIQPQMSFGTGHHQTTWMMSKAILELESIPDKVLDMGTGTGILAILAEKGGAKEILAIDIEEWSVENTKENVARNNCSNIQPLLGDIESIEKKKFGLILANINKNVLKSHMESYRNSLEKEGILLLSGFFETDVPELMTHAQQLGFEKQKEYNRESWAALQLGIIHE